MAFARTRLALLLTISSTAGIAVERSAFRLRPRHVESRMDRKGRPHGRPTWGPQFPSSLYSVFRYSMSAQRSASVSDCVKSWPALLLLYRYVL